MSFAHVIHEGLSSWHMKQTGPSVLYWLEKRDVFDDTYHTDEIMK